MAWSWSHTEEGIANVRANLEDLPREDKEIIFAEWRASQTRGKKKSWVEHFDQRRYDRALKYAPSMSDEQLDEFIWQRTQEFATCTNGGWEAYSCPFGCGCHLVPFSLSVTEEDECEAV